MTPRWILPLAAAVFSLAALACTAVVRASGTIAIHHYGGGVDTYRDVDIRAFTGSLFLTTDDGDGTLVIHEAACSYQGKIITCYPQSVALIQNGKSRILDLKGGTIYLNYTAQAQPMRFSSAKLPARGVLMSFTTRAGTLVNAHGTLDQVVRQ
jgi:hypothetical protein